MNLTFWRKPKPQAEPARSALSVDDFLMMLYQGHQYAIGLNQTQPGRKTEPIGQNYTGLAAGAYLANPVVAACIDARMSLFSEARLQFRQLRSGRPGDLFGTTELEPLERPWPGGTTGDLLARAMQDNDLAGNWFCVRRRDRLERLRPDWTVIIAGSEREDAGVWDLDVEVLGYAYQPGGPGSGREPELFLREQVAHFAPRPDPLARFRGVSWLTSLIREIQSDTAATDAKLAFFENGMTRNLVVKVDPAIRQAAQFQEWVDKFNAGHQGVKNFFKTIFLSGGSDATPIGSDFQQADLKAVQGAGETRIAAAARVPAVILGISEGLQGSSLNQGNYLMARRQFVDLTLRPLWRNIAGSLATIIQVPAGAELWYDDRDIPALRENETDLATIQEIQARTMATLVREGWDPASVQDAVIAGDYRRLTHGGMLSVQLQTPGQQPANGNGNGTAPAALSAAQ